MAGRALRGQERGEGARCPLGRGSPPLVRADRSARTAAGVGGGAGAARSAAREVRSFGDGLFVDLIPTSCWFTNVRTCVSPADWARVKALVVGRTGQRCEVCGIGAEPSHGLWLEAHERWSYDDSTRVQTLRRLVCLYTRCHRTTHFGFAEVTGQGLQAHAHLRAVNQWGDADADAHIATAARVWRARSAVDWSLDLSILTAAGVVPSPAPTAARRSIATDTIDRIIHDTP